MRETIIESVEENWRMNLGSDVGLVRAVLKMGKAIDYLVYEARLTGEETLELLSMAHFTDLSDVEIKKDHHYILTAFDD